MEESGKIFLENSKVKLRTEGRLEHSEVLNKKIWIAEIDEFKNVESPIEMLNNDCMLQIFLYLNFAERMLFSRVSKHWYHLCYESWKFVKKFDLRLSTWGKIPTIYIDEPKRGYTVRSIYKLLPTELGDSSDSENSDDEEIADFYSIICPTPENLEKDYQLEKKLIPFWNMKIVKKVLNLCRKSLRTLILGIGIFHCESRDFYPHYKWPSGWLSNFFKTLRNIKDIGIVGETFKRRTLSLKCLRSLPKENLEAVYFWQTAIGSEIRYFRESLISLPIRRIALRDCKLGPEDFNLIQRKETVKHLQLHFCRTFENAELYELMENISQLVNLCFLEIKGLENITDIMLQRIAINCKQIRTLKLNGLQRITDQGLSYLESLENLKYLEIGDLQFFMINDFRNFPTLKLLSITNFEHVSIPHVIEIVRNSTTLNFLTFKNTNYCSNVMETSRMQNVSRRGKQQIKVVPGNGSQIIICGKR